MALKRRLEAGIIETEADALEYAAMDRSAANRSYAAFIAGGLNFRRGALADLGAGICDLPVAVCRAARGVKVTAVEMSPAMLKLAALEISRARLGKRIRLLRGDARNTGLPAGSFDFVVSSSLIHHIPEPQAVFREIARLCRPGGGFFVQDLRRPRSLAELRGHLARVARTDTRRQRELLESSLRAALTPEEAGRYARRAGLSGFTLEEDGPRHWQLRRAAA